MADPSAKPGLIPNFTQQTLLYQFMKTFIEERPNIQIASRSRSDWNTFTTAPGEKTSMSFLQKLNNPNAQYLLQSVPKEILSTLQPIVELYWLSPDGKEEFLFPFNNFQDPQKFGIFNSVPGHLAVGLKDFSFDYLGTNPAEVDIKIKANLRLYFSSMDALFHEYRSKEGKHFSFSDLINRKKQVSSKKDNKSHLSYTADAFRTRISIRYLVPDDDFLREAVRGLKLKKQGVSPSRYMKEIKDAIRHSDVSFFLNLARHDINYQMDSPTMPFELSLEYWASAEVKFLSDEANLIALRPGSSTTDDIDNVAGTAAEKYRDFLNKPGNRRLSLLDSVQRDQIEIQEFLMVHKIALPGQRALKKTPENLHSVSRLNKITVDISAQQQIKDVFGGSIVFNDDNVAKIGTEQIQRLEDYFDLRKAAARQRVEEGADLASRREEAYTRILDLLLANNSIYRVVINPVDVQNWTEKKRTIGHNSRNKQLKEKYIKEGDHEAAGVLEKSKEDTAKGYYNTAGSIIRQIKDTAKIMTPSSSNQRNRIRLQTQLKVATDDGNPNNLTKQEIKELQKEIEELTKKIKGSQTVRGEGMTALNYMGDADSSYLDYVGMHMQDHTNINQGRIITQPRFEVDFFYLGDLIEAAIQTLKVLEPVKMKQYFEEQSRVILSNVEIFSPLSGDREIVNIGDIPVSLELWDSHWVSRIVKPAASVYAFRTFLRDIVTRIIPNAFTQKNLASGEIKNKVKADVEFFPLSKGELPRIVVDEAIRTAAIQVSKSSQRSETAIVLYATSNKPGNLKLNKEEDVKNGIYYLDVGTEGAPIHSINFSKQTIPGFLEAKIEDTGVVGDEMPSTEPYSATVSMLGNTFMRPGRNIVIRLPNMGDVKALKSRGRRLGLGGYFMIIKATNRLSEFGNRIDWKTEVEALWQDFGQDDERSTELNPFLLGQREQQKAITAVNFNENYKAGIARWEKSQEKAIEEMEDSVRTKHLPNEHVNARKAERGRD
jgi:hypothetical protein